MSGEDGAPGLGILLLLSPDIWRLDCRVAGSVWVRCRCVGHDDPGRQYQGAARPFFEKFRCVSTRARRNAVGFWEGQSRKGRESQRDSTPGTLHWFCPPSLVARSGAGDDRNAWGLPPGSSREGLCHCVAGRASCSAVHRKREVKGALVSTRNGARTCAHV